MDESNEKLLKVIRHYQDSLERHSKTGNNEKLLHALERLSNLPIKLCHLEKTGIGRTVNAFKKVEDEVGNKARRLVDTWKSMVQKEEDEEEKRFRQKANELTDVKTEEPDDENDPESLQICEEGRSDNEEDIYAIQRKLSDSQEETHSKKNKRERSRDDSSSDSEHEPKRAKHDHVRSSKSSSKYNNDSERTEDSSSNESGSENESKSHDKKNIKSYQSSSSDGSSNDSVESSSSDEDTRRSENKKSSDRKLNKKHSVESDSDGNSKNRDKQKNKYREHSSDGKKRRGHSNSSSDSPSDIDTKKKDSHKHREHSNGGKKSKGHSNGSADSNSENEVRKRHSKTESSRDKHKHKEGSDRKDSRDTQKKSKDNHNESKEKHGSSKDKHRLEERKDDKYRRDDHSSRKESSSSKSKSKSVEKDSRHNKESKESHISKSKHENEKDSKRSSRNDKSDSNSEQKVKESSHSSKEDRKKKDLSSDGSSKKHKSSRSEHRDKSSSSKSKDKGSSDKKRGSHGDKDKSDMMDELKKENTSSKSMKGKEKDKPKVSSASTSSNSKSKSTSMTLPIVNEFDSESGTSFADALGMLEMPMLNKSKKKSSVGASSSEKRNSEKIEKVDRPAKSATLTGTSKTVGEVPRLLKDPGELEPLEINVSSLLPSITPNYKPLGLPVDNQPRKMWSDDEALSHVITAKHQRTKVYSGNKTSYTKVPSLFELCSRVLQDNLDALEYTGGVPYSILKHILEKANPDQLFQLEFHNPYLIEDSDELWQLHCQKEFRTKKREELESWREMYLRCLDEREAKLKALTANIKQSQDVKLPVRTTKLAYMDSHVKPPRNIAKRQAKNGTAVDLKRPSTLPSERLTELAKSGEASKISVPNPKRAVADRSSSGHSSSSSHLKPKKAPLMAKTLSLLKSRFGRR